MPTIDPVKLHDLIIAYFNIEELNDVIFRLRVNKDEIDGGTIGTRAQALVEYCGRRGRSGELLDTCAGLRTTVDWEAVKALSTVTAGGVAADPQIEAARRELRGFQTLLAEGRQTYLRHNEQRGRLWRMIHQNHAGEMPAYKGYDDLFYKMYDRLNDEEMELFRIVRGNTLVGTHRINGRIRDWAEGHDVRAMFPEAAGMPALEREVMELRVHLNEWFAKYEGTFLRDQKRTLVYLGDEKRQGTKWPPGLDEAVAVMLDL